MYLVLCCRCPRFGGRSVLRLPHQAVGGALSLDKRGIEVEVGAELLAQLDADLSQPIALTQSLSRYT